MKVMRTFRRLRFYFNSVAKFLFHTIGVLIFKPFIGTAHPRSLDREAPHKILYVCLAYRGDLVISFPAISALRRQFPKAHITCWVRNFNDSLARINPDIDEVIVYDDFSSSPLNSMIEVFGGRRHLDFVKRLRKFDIYVDDSGYAFTAIAGFLAKIPLRIGRNFQGFGFLDHFEVPLDRNSQLIERRLKLLKVFGVKLSLNDVPKPYFKVDAHVRDAILRQHGLSHLKYFTIQPFAGWDAKNWGIDKYCMVSKLFASYSGMTPVFLGADYEDTLIDDAIRKQGMTAVNIAGAGGLKDTAAIIAAARMHFGADSVGSQLAISIGIKSLTIFGPVNPMLCSYLGGHNIGVIKRTRCMAKPGKLYCCFDAGRSCSRASCMKELSEDDVLRVLIDVWTGKERRPVVEL